ncbi:hypothetical protein BC629DRAFT_1531446 [Irpex lacteus]|nr:hypothetical protein BC629DRAFT_1531446 [Irpex lacteus]
MFKYCAGLASSFAMAELIMGLGSWIHLGSITLQCFYDICTAIHFFFCDHTLRSQKLAQLEVVSRRCSSGRSLYSLRFELGANMYLEFTYDKTVRLTVASP